MQTGHTPAVLWAPAKLTLRLEIGTVRPDGLHEVDAEMVSLDLCDRLDVFAADANAHDGEATSVLEVVGGGPDIPTDGRNLVCRALALTGRSARVRLTKHIPSQAGLGGGSADAAAILRWAGVTDLGVAVQLGSDVAFCLVGGRARVTGAGETVEPLPFEDLVVTLMTPPVACPTGAVFTAWDEMGGPRGTGPNDLEPAALRVAPELATWRDELAEATGQRPQLAGSGSTWFVTGAHPGPGRVVARTIPRPEDA